MRFESFSIEPEVLAQSKGYQSCPMSHKGLLLEILSLVWASEKQYTMPIPSELHANLGVEKDDIESLLSAVSNQGILDKQLCLEAGDLVLHSQLLEKSHKSQHMQNLKEQQITKKMQKSQQESNSLFDSLNEKRKGHEFSMGYLAPEERNLIDFTGWMPTSRFDANGQIYYVRSFFREDLIKEFPIIDVDMELNKIFRYLADNPERRKNLAYMNRFLRIWMGNASNPSYNNQTTTTEEQTSAIESELDRLIAMEEAS